MKQPPSLWGRDLSVRPSYSYSSLDSLSAFFKARIWIHCQITWERENSEAKSLENRGERRSKGRGDVRATAGGSASTEGTRSDF